MIKPIAHNEDNLRVDGGVKSNSSTSSSIAIVNHQEGDTLTKFSFLPIPEQLSPGNILFDDSGKAVLADFGITQIYDASRSSVFGDMSHVRYQAPELISGDAPSPTIACDVYAFGIVCYEALSETQPYSSFGTAVDVILAVYEGKAPFSHANKRIFDPPNLDEAFWDLMLSCWAGVPGHRPEIGQVFDGLKSISQVRRI
ncbi:hypothetical protein H0H87_001778 [Tephrocybe sp. NHM501043]|nr:hypothetical protein H0H87_001778 [Tephrocybe sp. NHM501043]